MRAEPLLLLFAVLCPFLVQASETTQAEICRASPIQVQGHDLWVNLEGKGKTTVVFEAGGGNDSSVWSGIAPAVHAMNAQTFVYDRAGLGKSALDPSPYSIEREAAALEAALDSCHIRKPVVLVAHSYGGFISLLTAANDRRVAGVVLVDAIVPGYYTAARTDALLAEYRPQYALLRERAPGLAQTMIPLMEAYPQSALTLAQANIPLDIPIIDIVAETSFMAGEDEIAAWRKAHSDFDAASPLRESVFAEGSGHKIMNDRPQLVLDAIARVLNAVK